jgi:hypothetical protein
MEFLILFLSDEKLHCAAPTCSADVPLSECRSAGAAGPDSAALALAKNTHRIAQALPCLPVAAPAAAALGVGAPFVDQGDAVGACPAPAVDPREPGVARAAVLALARPVPAALAVPGAEGRSGGDEEKEDSGEEEAAMSTRQTRGHHVNHLVKELCRACLLLPSPLVGLETTFHIFTRLCLCLCFHPGRFSPWPR